MLSKLDRISLGLFFARHKMLEACLVALVLVVVVFPDVIFLGASLRLTDQVSGSQQSLAPVEFYPIHTNAGWWGGYHDNGGAIYQSEPMIEFMRYSIQNTESPYWNPYSAAGSLGPETLVDQKFSAFTLVNAILGGGSEVYNVTMLFLFYFSILFLYRIVRERLQLSALAGVAGALFYLLNGYSTANFGSNVAQSYLYVPMCLYVSLAFLERPTATRFVAIVLSFAVLLSCTFIPTTVTSLLGVYAIIFGYVLARIRQGNLNFRSGATLAILQCVGVVSSVLLLSVLYLPIFENIRSTGTLDAYSSRVFFAINFPQAIASIFSPSHLYESYNAMEAAAISWNDGVTKNGINGNTVFHMGVIPIALMGCAIPFRRQPYNWLAATCALCILITFGRLFEPNFVERLMAHIPIVGKIGCQYWWPPVMISATFLVGFGISNLQRKNARIFPAFLLISVGVATMYYVYKIYGFQKPYIEYKLAVLIALCALTTIVIWLLLTLRFSEGRILAKLLAVVLVIGVLIELVVDSKMVRMPRSDIFTKPSEAIAYVRKNIGLHRTLNFGSSELYGEMGSALQVQEITSMNQGVFPSYQNYFYDAVNLDSSRSEPTRGAFPTLWQMLDSPLTHKFSWQAFDLLGMKYVLLPASFIAYKANLVSQGLRLVYETPRTFVLENPNVLPRAFAVNLPHENLESNVTLPIDFRDKIFPASIVNYKNSVIDIRGTAAEKVLVVISDNWHPKWRATVNGVEVPILRVNGTFRGIVVPAGEYRIRMNYQPTTLPLAIGLSLSVILLLAVIIFRRKDLDALIRQRYPNFA